MKPGIHRGAAGTTALMVALGAGCGSETAPTGNGAETETPSAADGAIRARYLQAEAEDPLWRPVYEVVTAGEQRSRVTLTLPGVPVTVYRWVWDGDRVLAAGDEPGDLTYTLYEAPAEVEDLLGFLTSWIVGHTDRFRAAVTCRSVNDLTSQMETGDIAGPQFGQLEYGANPWQDPELYHRESPLTYAANIRTPLLIQHSEKDLRTPMGQAEQLFTVLRSLKRPVRLMRVPGESHELTRSGAPYRRVENLERIRDWFVHYLVQGRTGLPRA